MEIKRWALRLACVALVAGAVLIGAGQKDAVIASDHDDGETNIKSRNTGLTDLFVFREDWHSGNAAHANNLVFVMCTNPRSLPRQHYYFNTNALYNFHVTRNASNDDTVSGREDIRFEFAFGAPNADGQQSIRMIRHNLVGGAIVFSETLVATTPLTTPARPLLSGNAPVTNTFTDAAGNTYTVFAGLREDPFFFDVNAFFKLRAAIRGSAGPTDTDIAGVNANSFATNDEQSIDFAKNYNVNAIVVRVPIAALQSPASETSFDVWETITLPSSLTVFQ